MRKMPLLNELPSQEVKIVDFKGLNKNISPGTNELVDCQNITLKSYPKATTRQPREVLYSDIINPQAIFKGSALYYIANGGFYADGVLKFSGLMAGPKSIVSFHSKILIFPDKKYYDETNATNGVIGNGSLYPAEGSCPDIDFVCVHDNRVFGVKGSTIYACALGNVMDWTTFVDVDGNPSDIGAFATDVASPGNFKGIYEYQSHVVLLKENYHHELYGQMPSNFAVIEISKTGTINNKSMIEVASILYFLNGAGVMRYGGGQASNISLNLNEKYTNGVMSGDGRFLYLSLYNGYAYNFYIYDTLSSMWCREDDLRAIDIVSSGEVVYCLSSDGKVYKLNSGTETIEWYIVLSDIAEIGKTNKKNVSVVVSLFATFDTNIEISVSEDRKPFRTVAMYRFDTNIVKNIPVSINAVSEFQLKIKGDDYAEIYNIEKVVIGGGNVWR